MSSRAFFPSCYCLDSGTHSSSFVHTGREFSLLIFATVSRSFLMLLNSYASCFLRVFPVRVLAELRDAPVQRAGLMRSEPTPVRHFFRSSLSVPICFIMRRCFSIKERYSCSAFVVGDSIRAFPVACPENAVPLLLDVATAPSVLSRNFSFTSFAESLAEEYRWCEGIICVLFRFFWCCGVPCPLPLFHVPPRTHFYRNFELSRSELLGLMGSLR